MFKQSTIDAVFNLDLVTVIKHYVPDLKKEGANYKAKSPFTEEKTPSFVVSPAKNRFKCFSTGKGGGNPIRFIQELHNVDFKQAINELASKFGIEIEIDDTRGEKNIEAAKKKVSIYEANKIAQEWFESFVLDPTTDTLKDAPNDEMKEQLSRANEDQIRSFRIGLSHPKSSLKDHLFKHGISHDLALEAGLLNKKEEDGGVKYTNPYHNRIVFPIIDKQNRVLGFSARAVSKDQIPKVINTKTTSVFNKSEIFLGMNLAFKEAGRLGEIIKVEGNFDVTAFHSKGMINTVATLGSAFTDLQAKEVKKHCNHIVLAIDNDKAGLKKVQSDVETCLSNGLTAELWISDEEGEDPFDFTSRNSDKTADEFKKLFDAGKRDCIQYLAEVFFEGKESVIEKTQAQKELTKLIAKIKDATLRSNYVKEFIKAYGIAKSDVENEVSNTILSERAKEEERATSNGHRLPSYLSKEDIEDFNEFRFYSDTKGPKTCGYHFAEGDITQHVSNFIVKPLYKILDSKDSMRLLEVILYRKGNKTRELVEITNNAIVSLSEAKKIFANSNGFFWGKPTQFDKLIRKIADEFVDAKPILTLGWQPGGFFAFANGIVKEGWQEVNNHGICVSQNENYYLPAFSEKNRNLPPEKDEYESDRLFIYKPSNVTFKEWATQFNSVYSDQQNGMFGVAFLVATLFSDWIFNRNDSAFPIFFSYGLPQTGKSTMGRSLSRVFKNQIEEYNLNSGTDVAFIRKWANIRNVIEHFDEYRNDIDEKRFQGCKQAYDRQGYKKGVMSRDNRTETTKVVATGYISGQEMPTRDMMALLSRTILRNFKKAKNEFNDKEVKSFLKLREMEDNGLSSIILEIIKYRSLIEEKFSDVLFEVNSSLKNDLINDNIEGRIAQNYAVLLATVKVLENSLEFPFTYEEMYNESKESILQQSELMQQSNEFAEFLKLIQFLILKYELNYNDDYIIRKTDEITIRSSDGKSKIVQFNSNEPTEVLLLNFSKMYPLYNQYHRSQKGTPGMAESALKEYMKAHKSYIGSVAAVRFGKQTTSAYAFKYKELPIQIGIDQFPSKDEGEQTSKENQTGNYNTPAIASQGFGTKNDDDLPF